MKESIDIAPVNIERIRNRLKTLYPDDAEACLANILRPAERYAPAMPAPSRTRWSERDIVLITYGDQIRTGGQKPLRTLYEFLTAQGLDELVSTIHILPFYPYSSDDGFSVIDYRAVDPRLGAWSDIHRLGRRFDLVFDLVVNHVSRSSRWFQEYLAGREPYVDYFIEKDPETDLSSVARARSHPLLTPVETSRATRHVWTTFSADQVDLNFSNPEVLAEMIDILLFYIRQGARMIRLDAVAYLWKTIGTPCIHLPQTHEIVRLLRDLVDALAPHVLLLTETNVPHPENVSYFGCGDEAHMVYQFSLPPLMLDAFLRRDARLLATWLSELADPLPDTTFFNFTASHDGIGLRPLEELVPDEQVESLIEAVKARGGLVSARRKPDGAEAPYELNISYLSALADPCNKNPGLHSRRFLTSQGFMLAMRGIPAVYFHSLIGTTNDVEGVKRSGQARRINRRKFRLDEITKRLGDAGSLQARVFAGYRHLLSVRIRQPAFHPDALQAICHVEEPWLIAFLRTSIDRKQKILVLANLSDERQPLALSELTDLRFTHDLLTGRPVDASGQIDLDPWSLVWLEAG